jgi:hypothetical protein
MREFANIFDIADTTAATPFKRQESKTTASIMLTRDYFIKPVPRGKTVIPPMPVII